MNRNRNWSKRFGRKEAIVTLVVFGLLFLGSTVYQYNRNTLLTRQVNATYQHALSELVDCVNNVDTTLSKTMVTNNRNQLVLLSADLWRDATFAKSNLGQLPLASTQLDNTANFLTQVGDFAYSLSRKMLDGQELNATELEQLASLSQYATTLSQTLQNMEVSMLNGSLNFQDASQQLGKEAQVFSTNMEEVEQKFVEYVSLTYDGPFSEHMANKTPITIKDKAEVSQQDAETSAKNFCNFPGVKSISVSEGNMPTFDCAMDTGDPNRQVAVQVTKKGGFVCMVTDNRTVSEVRKTVDEAAVSGAEFLKKQGFQNMRQTGFVMAGNCVDLAYAYEQSGVLMYPDLLKVRVALDDCSMVGFDARTYYTNHMETRPLPQQLFPQQQAIDSLKPGLQLESVNQCQIPLESGHDVYCYELKVKLKDKTYLIYINMENGREEKILELVQSANGNLSI